MALSCNADSILQPVFKAKPNCIPTEERMVSDKIKASMYPRNWLKLQDLSCSGRK
jgi:hypothetical protein